MSESDRRHGPKPRTIEQVRALLEAKLDALRLDYEEVAMQLEALMSDQEYDKEEKEPEEPTLNPVAQARWLKAARRELAELIREIEGPKPQPAPRSEG